MHALLLYILAATWGKAYLYVATLHHHNHRLTLARGNKVVHDMVHAALRAPSCLVFSHAMLQIENRIFLLRLVVVGGRIDHSPAPLLLRLGIILH